MSFQGPETRNLKSRHHRATFSPKTVVGMTFLASLIFWKLALLIDNWPRLCLCLCPPPFFFFSRQELSVAFGAFLELSL